MSMFTSHDDGQHEFLLTYRQGRQGTLAREAMEYLRAHPRVRSVVLRPAHGDIFWVLSNGQTTPAFALPPLDALAWMNAFESMRGLRRFEITTQTDGSVTAQARERHEYEAPLDLHLVPALPSS